MERAKKIIFHSLPLLIAVGLFAIPFFWFSPGEIDLGGDSSRLYFYDPISYLFSHSLYGVSSSGVGAENISYYGLPFISLLVIFKAILQFPTVLTASFHGLSLAIAFLAIYGILKEILISGKIAANKKRIELAAILSGLLYVFSPSLIYGWDKAIMTHHEFFVNPLMFYLLIRFFITQRLIYLFTSLLVTFVFSANFAFVGAPSFFAFYPIAIIFLLAYTKIILRKPLRLKALALATVLFLGLQAFHLLPQITELVEISSPNNQALFSDQGKFVRGLQYFVSIAQSVKITRNFFLLPQQSPEIITHIFFGIFPLIIVISFLVKKNRALLLIGFFFLFILFLASGNITQVGFEAYKLLFSIPGFSMFRNYWGKWLFSYDFFFVLLFGAAFAIVIEKIKAFFASILTIILAILLLGNAVQFISGELINKKLWNADRKIFVTFDTDLEKALREIRKLPIDGKFLTLPMADPGYQMFSGKNNGIYQGPSAIAYLAGKKDFAGSEEVQPYSELLVHDVKTKRYADLQKILALLNIKYLFYNSDPAIYNNFQKFPYEYVRQFFPSTQKEYKRFIEKLDAKPINAFGSNFHIYQIQDSSYLPHIYIPTKSIYTNDPVNTLGFISPDELRTGLLTYSSTVGPKNDSEVVLRLTNDNPLDGIRNNYHLHTHSPFISHSPDSRMYPFVLMKESFDLKNAKSDLDDYIARGLLTASKRIFELEIFGGDMPIHQMQSNKSEYMLLKNYNSWDTSIALYKKTIRTLIHWVNTSDKNESWKIKNRIIINEQLTKHEVRILHVIKANKKTRTEKQYLLKNTRKLFSSLYKEINLPSFDASKMQYIIKLPSTYKGKYEVVLKVDEPEKSGASTASLLYEQNVFSPTIDTKTGFATFGPLEIKKNNVRMLLNEPQVNLIEDIDTDEGSQKDDSGFAQSNRVFTYNDTSQSSFAGVIRAIKGWSPDRQYLISYDYNTFGNDFIFKFYEKQKGKDNDVSVNAYFDKLLHSDSWATHQTIITSSINAIAGYVQFFSDNSVENSKINIRNLTVTEVKSPQVFIKSIDNTVRNTGNIPKITFTKINPTKYTVNVVGITNPFYLLFSDKFSAKWKLYPVPFKKSGPIIASYFNGDISEGVHKTAFFDPYIFSNLKKNAILEKSHFVANAYANAWYITPEDVKGKKDASFILEFTTQRYFYMGMIISGFSLFITFLLIILAYKYEKR